MWSCISKQMPLKLVRHDTVLPTDADINSTHVVNKARVDSVDWIDFARVVLVRVRLFPYLYRSNEDV